MKPKKKIYFNGLNPLRFIAAISIVIFHATLSIQGDFNNNHFLMFLHNLPVAVDFFFLISGFLIIYLLLEEKETFGNVSIGKFFLRRLLRIGPLYFLILGYAFLLHHNDGNIDFSKFVFFIGNFWMIDHNSWTEGILNPLWSINIEEHFYLVVPFLIAIFPLKKINYLFWIIIVVSFGFRVYSTTTIDDNWMTIYMHTLSQIDLMAMGGLLAFYHKKHPLEFDISPVFPFLIGVFIVLLLTFVDTKDFSSIYNASIKKYLFALPLLSLLVFFIFNINGKLDVIKNNKYLNYLGKISFGIYLFNVPVINLLEKVEYLRNCIPALLVLAIFFTIVISSISYELYEKQFLKLKTTFQKIEADGGK